MDSSSGSNVIVSEELTSRSLPSLFGLCNGTVSATTMAGKDLDGLIALNDSALSQQIEFILQDATMEQDDNAQEITQSSTSNIMQHHHTIRMVKAKESMSVDYDSNSQATSMSPTAVIKLETPPTSTTPITSASDLSQTGLESEFTQIKSPKNQIQLQIKHQQQQQNHVQQQLVRHHNTQQHLQQQLLNGRRIIIRNSSGLNDISTVNITNLNNHQILPHHLAGEEEDPELNDENLQDIEEEAKAAEAEEEPSLQFHTANTHIKLEDSTELTLDTAGEFIHTNSTGHLPTTTTQLVLPRSITVPVSEALINLQRRPVFISNAGGNIQGGTIVRMPAVLNRNGSMTVFNVVQQNGNVIGGAPTTTQLILQTAAVTNAGGNATANVTPLMVTSSAQTNKIIAETPSTNLTNNQLPIAVSRSVLINNASPTNAKTIITTNNNKNNANNNNNNSNNNNSANSFSRIVANGNILVSSTSPNSVANILTESQFDNHPVASTSAAALATLNALNNNSNNNNNNKNNNNINHNNNINISNNSTNPASLSSQSTATTSTTTKVSSSPLSSSSNASTASPSNGIIYQCVDCVEKFDSKDLFDIHRSGHANNMKCAICNMVLKSLKNYEKHCLRCKPYECQICGRVVRFRPNFIKHMRVHTGQQSERHKYKCEVCHKEFMSFEYFKVHKKIHNENVNLTCEICGKVFSALASLRGHSKLHSGVKLHKCDVCGKGFGQRYNLKIHARTHTGDFPYECKICKKKLHTQSSLQTHMQVHQREQPREQSQQQTSANASANASATTSSTKIRYQSSNNNNPNTSLLSSNNSSVIKIEPRSSSSSSSSNNSSTLSPSAKTLQRGKSVLRKNQSSILKLQQQQLQQHQQNQQLYMHMNNINDHDIDGTENYNDDSIMHNDIHVNDVDGIDDDIDDNNSGLSESDLNGTSFHRNHHHNHNINEPILNHHPLYMNEDVVSGGSGSGGSGSGHANGFGDDSSSGQSSNISLNNLHMDQQQTHLIMGTPTSTIVVNNYASGDSIDKSVAATATKIQQPQHNQAQVIRHHKNVDSASQQQQLRKTPIIHSTSGLTNNNMQQHAQSVLQQTGAPTTNILLTSATATNSSMSGSVSSIKKLITNSTVGVIDGGGSSPFTTSTIIRSTHNSQVSPQQHQQQSFNINSINSNNKYNKNQKQQQQQSSLYQRNNHRNHHRRRHLTDLDDDDDDDDDINVNVNVCDDVRNIVKNNGDSLDIKLSHHTLTQTIAQPTTTTTAIKNRLRNNGRRCRRPFDHDDDMMADDDDDVDVDDKCSPSLALTAIKTEPNLYATGDNSNDMLIKEEAIFDNSPTPQSPQSPPSSRYRLSNFDNDLEHHADLSHSLPTYGYLLDHHTIPDDMPSQLYADDDDDDEFKLGHSTLTVGSIGGGGSISSLAALNTTDTGDYIKKEWPSYGSTSAYSINGKFDDDSDVLCDAANFIYN